MAYCRSIKPLRVFQTPKLAVEHPGRRYHPRKKQLTEYLDLIADESDLNLERSVITTAAARVFTGLHAVATHAATKHHAGLTQVVAKRQIPTWFLAQQNRKQMSSLDLDGQ